MFSMVIIALFPYLFSLLHYIIKYYICQEARVKNRERRGIFNPSFLYNFHQTIPSDVTVVVPSLFKAEEIISVITSVMLSRFASL